jgi:voltage-gated potassium channel
MRVIRAYLGLAARWRWSLLLGLTVTAFLVEPMLGKTPPSDFLVKALFAAIAAGAVEAARIPPRLARIGHAIAGLWLLLQAIELAGINTMFALPTLTAMMLGGVLAVTFAFLVTHRDNGREALTGAVFGYFLLAMAWTMVFTQLEAQAPGAFFRDGAAVEPGELGYFALVTITTLGFGDIVPVHPMAQVLTGFAAVSGVLYVAVLIGSIVGGFQSGSRNDRQ